MTHQFQHCILKLSFSSYLFIKHEHFFADKAWLSSLLALPNLFCFFQVLVFLLRVSSYKNFKRISNGATVVSHSYMLQVYVLYSPLHKIKQQAEEKSFFFIFSLVPPCPPSFLIAKFSAENRFSIWPPVWPISNESNVIRKSSWKEQHLTVDSPDTDQCKLLLRKNKKKYPVAKDDENKAKKNGMAS